MKILKKRFFHSFLIFGILLVLGFFILVSNLDLFSIRKHDFHAILNWTPQSETVIYDRDENEIASLYNKHHIYFSFNEIPEKMIQAILSIEDKKFWTHSGFDLIAMARSFVKNIRYPNRRKQGASTITQQLVKNFVGSNEKSFIRKIKEVFLAYKLETMIEKEKILEIYLNALFLGNGSYGVGAAAKRYFNKDLTDLKTHEFALLAGLFQAPSSLNPIKHPEKAKARQRQVLRAMVLAGYISKKTYYQQRSKELVYESPEQERFAPFFIDHITQKASEILKIKTIRNKGLHIYTTVDSHLQDLAEESILKADSNLNFLEEKTNQINGTNIEDTETSEEQQNNSSIVEAALLSNDIKTGEILSMVGGRDFSKSQFNRATKAYRQPGSAFKPIVYSLALSHGYKWSDVRYIAPLNLPGSYKPRSSQIDYLSETTLLRALYRSINSISLELGKEMGIKKVLFHAEKLGIKTPLKEEYGTLIGSSELSLPDLARVYSTLANGGQSVELYSIQQIVDSEGYILYEYDPEEYRKQQIISEEVSYLTTMGLQSVLKYGTAKKSKKLSTLAAGKTGTSNNSKDNWFCGYTSKTATIVWVGSDDFKPLTSLAQGSTAALPIWNHYTTEEIKYLQPAPFEALENLIELKIHPKFGYQTKQGISMWFNEKNIPHENKSSLDIITKETQYRTY